MGVNDLFWMQEAYALALQASEAGEVPVGAVLVSTDNSLLGKGYNQVISRNDPSAHAEIVALREAAAFVGNYRLLNTTLYVTLEPCLMCAAAMVHARIKRLVFACKDPKTGAAGSVFNVLGGFPLNHAVQVEAGVMADECSLLLKRFFQSRRLKNTAC